MTYTPEPTSTIEPPPGYLRFKVGQVGGDTIEKYLRLGFSLGIICMDCRRLVEWTPPELVERFGTMIHLKLADLVPRLSCKGERGCGSDNIAVFPHLYDGEWTWPQADEAS